MPPKKRLKAVIRRLVRAEVAYSWRGSLTAAWEAARVEDELGSAKKALKKVIKEVLP